MGKKQDIKKCSFLSIFEEKQRLKTELYIWKHSVVQNNARY